VSFTFLTISSVFSAITSVALFSVGGSGGGVVVGAEISPKTKLLLRTRAYPSPAKHLSINLHSNLQKTVPH
jgi:hypothetical protein